MRSSFLISIDEYIFDKTREFVKMSIFYEDFDAF